MRIDLPCCSFKYCRYSFDGNCTNKNKYETCEYQLGQMELDRLKKETEKVVYAKWKKDKMGTPRCSNCGYDAPCEIATGKYVYYNICPECGAKMNSEEVYKAEVIKEFVEAIEKRLEHNWDASWEVYHSVMGSIHELAASRGVE